MLRLWGTLVLPLAEARRGEGQDSSGILAGESRIRVLFCEKCGRGKTRGIQGQNRGVSYMNHVTDLCRLFRFSQSLTQDIVAIIDSVIHNTTVEDHKKMLQLFMQRQFHAYTPKHLQWNQDINELICHINRYHKDLFKTLLSEFCHFDSSGVVLSLFIGLELLIGLELGDRQKGPLEVLGGVFQAAQELLEQPSLPLD